MIITEKMIRELQRRVDVSYEEAERYLRRAGGNIEIAQAYCNKRNSSVFSRLFHEIEKLINATLIYRIKLYKGKDQFINLPVFYFILFVLIVGVNKSLFVGVVFIILSLISDCNIEMAKVERRDPFSFYKTVDKMGNKEHASESAEEAELEEILVQSTSESVDKDNNLDNELDVLKGQEYEPSHTKIDSQSMQSTQQLQPTQQSQQSQSHLQQSQEKQQTAQYSPFPSDMDRRVSTQNEQHNDEEGYYEVTIDK